MAKSDNGRAPKGTIPSIIEELECSDWMDRNMIYNEVNRIRKAKSAESNAIDFTSFPNNRDSVQSESAIISPPLGGRPNGSSIQMKENNKKKLEAAKEIAAEVYQKAKLEAQKEGKIVKRGHSKEIIADAIASVGLSKKWEDEINFEIIRKRVARGNTKGFKGSIAHTSPLAPIEPLLVELCITMNRMHQSITKSIFIDMVNALIKDSPSAQKLLEYKKVHCRISSGEIGVAYYTSFMARHEEIWTTRPSKVDVNRAVWATYENIKKMYEIIYEEMVLAGIAKKHATEQWFSQDGKIVATENNAFGRASKYELIHPDELIMMDEVGSNTNMKKDGNRGGKLVIAERGCRGKTKAVSTDIHYTALGLTFGSGKVILCVIILPSEKDKIEISWITGINVAVLMQQQQNGYTTTANNLSDNVGAGKAMPGGPVCYFCGVEVPCLVRVSPHGGITTAILTDILRHLDALGVYNTTRAAGRKPFVLVDGHQSRFDLDFLQYIRDEDHCWSVCFGVPYGTHLWQTADSEEQNGAYKIAETAAKEELLQIKEQLQWDNIAFAMTDVIPIVNRGFSLSFARVETNQHAILNRGWNPLTWILLDHPEVKATMQTTGEEPHPTTTTSRILTTLDGQDVLSSCRQLNFINGRAGDILKTVIKESDRFQMREQIKKEFEDGTRLKKTINATKKVTSGVAFSHGILGLHSNEMQQVLETNAVHKATKMREKKQREYDRWSKRKEKVSIVRKKPQTKWSLSDLQTMLVWKKRKGDKAPSKIKSKDEAAALWECCKGCDSPACLLPDESDGENIGNDAIEDDGLEEE